MIIYLAMIFGVFEMLSMLFNQYFVTISFLGINFPLNISVVFFCIGFFILDIVTELYTDDLANKLIYGKVICQIIFVVFSYVGIIGAGLQNSQLSEIISTTPSMMVSGIIASLVGYKITTSIMQKMKIIYHGEFLMMRYLCSTLPGEIAFSLIFAGLSFSKGKTFSQFLMLFAALTFIKLICSIIFSIIAVPITNLLKYFAGQNQLREFLPFK